MQEKKAPPPKTISLKIRSGTGDKTLPVSNQLQVAEFKTEYINALELGSDGIEPTNLRFFCMGKELKDELFLYSYDINNDMVVQAMIKK